MKKLILLISVTLLLISCNKSIYYEYLSNGKYATFEIQNNNIAVYRSNSNNYIYTKSTTILNKVDSTISFSLPYSMYYFEKDQEKFNLCGFKHKTNEDKYMLITYLKSNEDSIISISKADRNRFLKNGSCFVENNVNWFPPYFTRVKKIDYKKFNLPQIEDKYLKDPIKAPKTYE